MSTTLSNFGKPVVLGALLLSLPGCAGVGMGSLEDILGSAGGVYGGDVSGEIRQVDTRRQEIEVASGWGGAQRFRYDGRTEVVYRQRRYDVRSLERGDLVRIRVDSDRYGERYASYIQVQESARDRGGVGRGGNNARLERFGGSVGRIDDRSGSFELHTSRDGRLLVYLPNDPPRSMRDRFRRLRRGDRINVDVYLIDRSRAELRRFR
jgi:hypothetical protein